jgi:hypothetical protein
MAGYLYAIGTRSYGDLPHRWRWAYLFFGFVINYWFHLEKVDHFDSKAADFHKERGLILAKIILLWKVPVIASGLAGLNRLLQCPVFRVLGHYYKRRVTNCSLLV